MATEFLEDRKLDVQAVVRRMMEVGEINTMFVARAGIPPLA